MNSLFRLAEMIPNQTLISENGTLPGSGPAVVVVFLVLICLGLLLDVALLIWCLKNPDRFSLETDNILIPSFSGRIVSIVSVLFAVMYFGCSYAYTVFFPGVEHLESSGLFFQGLFFNLPALLVIIGVFRYRKMCCGAAETGSVSRVFKMLGLSVVIYLALLPALWSVQLLYQFLLYGLGIEPDLQEVIQVFMQPTGLKKKIAMHLIAVVLAPAVEEGFFRGILFPWVIRQTGY